MINKHMTRVIAIVLSLMMVGALLCACGAGDDYSGGSYYSDEGAYSSDNVSAASKSSGAESANVLDNNRKIIETYDYSVETKTFDEFIAAMESKIKELGGYIESCDTYTSAYNEYSSTDYTVRIPTDKKDDFASFVTENSTVLRNSVSTQDVTLQYVDVESRLKALRLEQESLEELLEKSSSVSDIIEVRDRLSEVIYEIESYESQLRSMDTDIEYTTFSISVSEVEHVTTAAEASIWQRIGDNLKTNFSIVGKIFKGLFIILISGLPFWLMLGGIAVLVVVIVKLSVRHSRKKRMERAALMAAYPAPDAVAPQTPAAEPEAPVQPVAEGEPTDE